MTTWTRRGGLGGPNQAYSIHVKVKNVHLEVVKKGHDMFT